MSSVHIAPPAPDAAPAGRKPYLAVGFVALLAAASIVVAPWDTDRAASVESTPTAPTAPLMYGDAPVAKGAHGKEPDDAKLRVFGDPVVRKGARR